MNQKKLRLLPFVTAIIIFASLLAALLSQRELLPGNRIVSITFGLFAFSLMLTQVLISLRPKFLEQKIGLSAIYEIHGKLALILVLASGLPPVFVPTSELVKTVSWHPHSFIGLAAS